MTVPVGPSLEFRVLGPLRVLNSGVEVPLGGEKPRAVLALLLTHRNRLVSTDAFAEEIWSKGTEHTLANLQVVIGKLRKALAAGDDHTGGHRYVVTSGPGYMIKVEDERMDLARFQQHRPQLLRVGGVDLSRRCDHGHAVDHRGYLLSGTCAYLHADTHLARIPGGSCRGASRPLGTPARLARQP